MRIPYVVEYKHTVSNIYKHVLKNYGFNELIFITQDSHAYYFDGSIDDKPVNIKVVINGEQVEVWSRSIDEIDYEFVTIII